MNEKIKKEIREISIFVIGLVLGFGSVLLLDHFYMSEISKKGNEKSQQQKKKEYVAKHKIGQCIRLCDKKEEDWQTEESLCYGTIKILKIGSKHYQIAVWNDSIKGWVLIPRPSYFKFIDDDINKDTMCPDKEE